MKKNTFIQGTIITSLSLIFIKVLGALYVIPFYRIIGEDGGTLYSYAYNIYNLFLNITSVGIPIAISMIISEYHTLKMYDAKERAYRVGKRTVTLLAILSFLTIFIFAPTIAKFLISDISGGSNISDIVLAIRAISFCLLIIPFLSILRGYLQGNKFIAPTSISQVLEQVVRIAVVLVGAYIAIKVFKLPIAVGVAISLLGAFFGGLAAFIYLRIKVIKNKDQFPTSKERDDISNKALFFKIIKYCIPLIIISVVNDLYTIIDIKLIIKGLHMLGYSIKVGEVVSSIVATWAPKICTIIITIATALTTNIIPHMVSSFVKKDMETTNKRFNQAISTMLYITVPMSILLFLLADKVYFLFYGVSDYGPIILKFSAISHIFVGVWTIINTCLQSMKHFKIIYINSIAGLLINALLDIPLILLFDRVGFSPFVAAVVSTCIGCIVSITIVLIYLHKKEKFNYKFILSILGKLLIPSLAIILPIVICNHFIKFDYNYINVILSLCIYGIYGVLVYVILTYKNKLIDNVFGEDEINKIISKFKKKKIS